MSDMPDAMETALYRSFWDDGLLDLLVGVALLAIGTAWSCDLVALGAVAPAMLVPLWAPLRAKLIEPRAGYVEFSLRRRERTARGLRSVLLLGTAVLALGIGGYVIARNGLSHPDAGRLVAGLPGALLALGGAIVAGLTGARRFLLHGLVLLCASIGAVSLAAGPAWPMLIGGATVALTGGILLARFLAGSARFEEDDRP